MLDEILAQEYPKQETLKDGTKVTIRPLEADDVEALYAFFQSIPRKDRIFLKGRYPRQEHHPGMVQQHRLGRRHPHRGDRGRRYRRRGLAASRAPRLEKSHIGKLRLVVHPDFRRQGLAVEMINELIAVALHTGSIEQLNAECMVDVQRGAILLLQLVGFVQRAILPGQVRDIEGTVHDLALLSYTLRDQEDFPALD